MKGKLTGILLLFCFIAPMAATYVILKSHKKQVRREVKWKMIAGIDKGELVLLKFTEKETQTNLRWKHSKEFEHNGQMYDVVERLTQGDSIFYWCWWDHKETKLNQQLNKLLVIVLGDNQQKKHHQEHLITFYKSLYCTHFPFQTHFIALRENESIKPCELNYYSNLFPPPVPPPQIG